MTLQLEKNVDKNIEILKTKKHFNHIEWHKLKDSVKMIELKDKLKRYKNLELEGTDNVLDDFDPLDPQLQKINKKIEAATEKIEDSHFNKFKNIEKMSSGETFKGQKRGERHKYSAPLFKTYE